LAETDTACNDSKLENGRLLPLAGQYRSAVVLGRHDCQRLVKASGNESMACKQTKDETFHEAVVVLRIDRIVAFVAKSGVEPLGDGFDLRLITKITV
jgi:hypothetical protein